jgi:hypothetical protein
VKPHPPASTTRAATAFSIRTMTDFGSKRRSISVGRFRLRKTRAAGACAANKFGPRARRLEVPDFANCCSDHVRHVTGHLSDSTQLRGARERCPWAIQLTRRRKPERTTACWRSRDALKTCRVMRGEARVIRRKLHCLNSRFQRCNTHSLRNHVWRSHRLTAVFTVAAGALGRWAGANEASQGTERSAYVTLHQLMSGNMGSPTGREPHGDGALVVVRGRESRPHGEGGQVSNDRQHVRGARDA